MDNIVLDVLGLNPSMESVDLVLHGKTIMEGYITDYDEYLDIETTPTFILSYTKDKTLRIFSIEAGMDRLIEDIQVGKIDKLKGLYDIPEWKLYDLTAGEAVLHAWVQAHRRYPLESVQNKVREACKTLRRGELRFKEILEAKEGFKFGNFPTK